MKISVKCPACQKPLECEKDWIGMDAQCPECENNFTITENDFEKEVKKLVTSANNSRNTPQVATTAGRSWKIPIIACSALVIIIFLTFIIFFGIKVIKNKNVTGSNARIEDQSKSKPVSVQTQTLPVAANPQEKSITKNSKTPSVSDWERQNRDILIKMITDGHVYFSENEQSKTLATYGMLFELIGNNEVQDVTLKKLVDQARNEYDQIKVANKEKERQKALLLQGIVTIAKKNGEHIFPQTQVFLAPIDSPIAKNMQELLNHVKEYSSCERKKIELDMQFEKARGSLNMAAIKQAGEQTRKFLTEEVEAWKKVLNDEISFFKQAATIPATKTDAQGQFIFADIIPGKYILMAKATVGGQRVYWINSINKEDAPQTFTLDNDKAEIITEYGH